MFALVAGVPETGEASGAAFSQVGPRHPAVVTSDPQGVVDAELRRGADLVPGGPLFTIELYRLFFAESLSLDSAHWSAQSSDTGVVTVGFNMGRGRGGNVVGTPNIWIRPVGTGEATITGGYTGYGNSLSFRFTVRVVARAPVDGGGDDPPDTFDPVALPQRDRRLTLETPGQLPAKNVIRANDQMADYSAHWSARSSDTGVVTVSWARSRVPNAGLPPTTRTPLILWLWPEGEGEATITVGYSRHGKSATSRLTVRVISGQLPLPGEDDGEDDGVGPVANVQEVVNDEVEQAGGLESGGGAVPIDVNKLFSNVGSGATGRDFDARSSDGRVVTVEVTDNPHVVIRPVGDGTATVTVRYTGGGRLVSAVFGVAVGEGFVAPVPALPLAAAGLLAALLFGAGLRRRRRP